MSHVAVILYFALNLSTPTPAKPGQPDAKVESNVKVTKVEAPDRPNERWETRDYNRVQSRNVVGIEDLTPFWESFLERGVASWCQQYDLSTGARAYVVYDESCRTSLFLIFRADTELLREEKGVKTTTEDGSLQAWMLRHDAATQRPDSEHDDREWTSFLALSEKERAKLAAAFQLKGSARIRLEGDLIREAKLELESVDPVPIFDAWLDKKVEHWKKAASEARVTAEDLANIDLYIGALRLSPRKPAKFEGSIEGRWRKYRQWNPRFNFDLP